eukprot:scaffold11025_cov41-Phaeocystis_antarctica.AAC.2
MPVSVRMAEPLKKIEVAMTAPRLPPAPTMPETTPSAGRETYGTTPNVRPSAIWTATEKRNMTRTTMPTVPELEMQSVPPWSGDCESTTVPTSAQSVLPPAASAAFMPSVSLSESAPHGTI